MTRTTSKRCICGRSQKPPFCDGSHQSEGWRCAERDGQALPFAFVASRSLSNLADRLAHRFEGASFSSPQTSARCKRLVIIADGHDIQHLRKICGSVQAEQLLVMCVGVPSSVLAWAFPEAVFLSLESESPALLWKSAETQLLAEPKTASQQAPPRVFLSHSVQDEALLFPIVQALRGHFQIPVFVCADSIPTGSGWHGEIQKQLEQCDLFLFAVSEAANRSVFCAFEAGMAMALGKPIHLISVDGQSPPTHLQHLQAIDANRLQRRKPWLTPQDALLEASLLALSPEEFATFLRKKSQVQVLAGDADEARPSLSQTQDITAELRTGGDSQLARATGELAEQLGDARQAGSGGDQDEAAELALLEAERLLELGRIEYDQTDYPKAMDCYQEAMEIFQRQGNRSGEGRAFGNLGAASRSLGQLERARDLYTQAVDIHREVGNRRYEGIILGNLGTVFQSMGQQARATELYTQAIEVCREVGNKRHEGINLGNLGNVSRSQNQHERAIEFYKQAIDIHRETGNKRSEGIDVGNLGDSLFQLRRLDEAETMFRQAIPISEETIPAAAGAFRGSLALLLAQQDKLDEAQSLLKTGESQVAPYLEELAKFLCNKGKVQHLAGEEKVARDSLKQAQETAAELKVGEDSEVARAIQELVELLGDSGIHLDEQGKTGGTETQF